MTNDKVISHLALRSALQHERLYSLTTHVLMSRLLLMCRRHDTIYINRLDVGIR